MKYISFVIPCFNSSAYMRHCIESCLISDDVEVLIIDDGSSKDNTLEIAKEYEKKYPNVCRAIHKENGGHGSVVNLGIKEATGLFLKVVDSDDWLDSDLLKKVLENIKKMDAAKKVPDLIITNYIYDKVDKEHKKVMRYADTIIPNIIMTWDSIKDFKIGQYLLMHSLMYKTSILKDCHLDLPEHTFYVDNIFAYKPLPCVDTLIYFDYDLYHYYIGREDQSVNEKVMIGRLDQQYRVTYKMLDDVNVWDVKYKKLQDYMVSYMSIIMTISSILSIRSKDEKWYKEKDKLWAYVKKKDFRLYCRLFFSITGIGVNLPTAVGRAISSFVYTIAQKVVGFN